MPAKSKPQATQGKLPKDPFHIFKKCFKKQNPKLPKNRLNSKARELWAALSDAERAEFEIPTKKNRSRQYELASLDLDIITTELKEIAVNVDNANIGAVVDVSEETLPKEPSCQTLVKSSSMGISNPNAEPVGQVIPDNSTIELDEKNSSMDIDDDATVRSDPYLNFLNDFRRDNSVDVIMREATNVWSTMSPNERDAYNPDNYRKIDDMDIGNGTSRRMTEASEKIKPNQPRRIKQRPKCTTMRVPGRFRRPLVPPAAVGRQRKQAIVKRGRSAYMNFLKCFRDANRGRPAVDLVTRGAAMWKRMTLHEKNQFRSPSNMTYIGIPEAAKRSFEKLNIQLTKELNGEQDNDNQQLNKERAKTALTKKNSSDMEVQTDFLDALHSYQPEQNLTQAKAENCWAKAMKYFKKP